MKRLFLIVLMAAAVSATQAQIPAERLEQARREAAQAGKDKKEKEKQLQMVMDSVLYHNAAVSLYDSTFVIKADQIMFRRGAMAYVDQNTNFISMNKDKATVQIAFNTIFAGPNGIGGVTVEGAPSNVSVSEDKRGNLTLTMSVVGVGISAQVSVTLWPGSNKAMATVVPNFNSRTITVYGNLYPISQTNVFKGTAL